MKYLLMTLAVVMIFAAPALAADGNVSSAALAKMGLSGLSVMSDDQGAAVRGMGFIAVGSVSVVIKNHEVAGSAAGVLTDDKNISNISVTDVASTASIGCISTSASAGCIKVTFATQSRGR